MYLYMLQLMNFDIIIDDTKEVNPVKFFPIFSE